MTSAFVSTTWGLLLPLIGFGDQVLDFWFIANNWDSIKYVGLRETILIHLIVISVVQFVFGYSWIGQTCYPRNKWFRGLWGLLCWFNFIQVYLFFTIKKCCSSKYCGGKFENTEFNKKSKQMLKIQFAIHAFGEDMFQVTFQLFHLLSYYDSKKTNLSENLNQGLDILSIFFGMINLIFAVLYFLILHHVDCCCSCLGICCDCFLQNKGREKIEMPSMCQLKYIQKGPIKY